MNLWKISKFFCPEFYYAFYRKLKTYEEKSLAVQYFNIDPLAPYISIFSSIESDTSIDSTLACAFLMFAQFKF